MMLPAVVLFKGIARPLNIERPSLTSVFSFHLDYSSKEDGPHLAVVQDQGDPWRGRSKLLSALRLAKIHLIESSSMSYVSAIKLIRTDTTLDLSQKAEKRCLNHCLRCKQIRFRSTDDLWAKLKQASGLAVSLSCCRLHASQARQRGCDVLCTFAFYR